MVIVILAVLAAFALPRFADLSNESHIAVTKSVMGSFRSVAQIAHGEWQLNNQPTTITLQGSTINMSPEGWPDNPALTDQGCVDLWNQVLDTTINIVPFALAGAPDEWSALQFGGACVYINQHGTVFDNTQTPFFNYFPNTGTGAPFNLN